MPRLMKVAKKYNVKVIEDNCDGWGSTINGKKVGSFGHVSITSFHAAHIVSMGVGGGVFTNDKRIESNVRMYRDWGRQANTTKPNKYRSLPRDYNPRFVYDKIGYNFQILELQAAMGRVQLKKSELVKRLRQKNFKYLYNRLNHLPLIMPKSLPNADICWFAFPISVKPTPAFSKFRQTTRGELVKYLEKHGIETRSMFGGDITKHPAYKNSKYRVHGKLTEANYILKHSFWITCHPRLKKADLDYIIKVFKDYYAQSA